MPLVDWDDSFGILDSILLSAQCHDWTQATQHTHLPVSWSCASPRYPHNLLWEWLLDFPEETTIFHWQLVSPGCERLELYILHRIWPTFCTNWCTQEQSWPEFVYTLFLSTVTGVVFNFSINRVIPGGSGCQLKLKEEFLIDDWKECVIALFNCKVDTWIKYQYTNR